MFTRTVALALLLSFPAFAQPTARLLPVAEPSSPPLLSIDGDRSEHSASWQFVGLLEGIVTGALLFSLGALASRNQSSGGLSKADDAVIGGWAAFGATLFGAGGVWLGTAARDDDGGGEAARRTLVWHGALLAVGATGTIVLGLLASVLFRGGRNDPAQTQRQ